MLTSKKLQFLNYVVLFLLAICCTTMKNCSAQKNNQSLCVPSSCGKIVSISYPFRLKTDPKHCGKPRFELDCQNNQTIITFNKKSFHVESINYRNYTIRMTDPGLVQESNFCSYPNFSLVYDDIPYDGLSTYKPGKFINDFTYLNNIVVFVNCLNAVNSPQYILLNDTLCRSNSSGSYKYLTVGVNRMSLSDLADSCSVDRVSWASLTGPAIASAPGNASWAGIRRSLGYGFELSFHNVLCDNVCDPERGACIIIDYQATCKEYCYESTPYENKSFRCKLDFLAPFIFFYGLIGIAVLVVLRFLLGLCCIGVLVSRERKRRHLWEMTHKNDQVWNPEA